MSELFRQSRNAFTFYIIALGLAIFVAFLVPWVGEASLPLTMLTPAIAAMVMLAFVAPEGGFRQCLRLLGLTHAGLKGWPMAILGPFVIHGAGLAIMTGIGLAVFAMPQASGPIITVFLDIIAGLLISTVLALGEEVGWRGYMLPRVKGVSVIAAMMAVGFLHGVWHLPIMLTTDYYHSTGNPLLVVPLFLVTLTLAGVFFGFLRLWSGSVWPVAIAHAAANTAWNLMTNITQTKSAIALEYVGGESGLVMIGGLLMFVAAIAAYLKRHRFAW